MEQGRAAKRRLSIDWNKLLGSKDEEPPPAIVIEPTTRTSHSPRPSPMDFDREHLVREECKRLSDSELDEKIHRLKTIIDATSLPDKGEKLLRNIKLLQEERGYRKLRRVEKEATGCENLSQPTTSSVVVSDADVSIELEKGGLTMSKYIHHLDNTRESITTQENAEVGQSSSVHAPPFDELPRRCCRVQTNFAPIIQPDVPPQAFIDPQGSARLDHQGVEFHIPFFEGTSIQHLHADLEAISQDMQTAIMNDYEKIVSMDPIEAIRRTVRHLYIGGAVLGLTTFRYRQEIERNRILTAENTELKEQVARSAQLQMEADVLLRHVKEKLAEKERILIESLARLNELEGKLNDPDQLKELFKETPHYNDLQDELFEIGVDFTCKTILKHHPKFDISFIQVALDALADGTSNIARQQTASSSADSLSPFTSCFYQKLEDKTGRKNSAFDQELSTLGCPDHRRLRYNGKLTPKVKQKGQISSRRQPFKCANHLSLDVRKRISSDADQNSTDRDHFKFNVNRNLPGRFDRKKDASPVQNSDYLRPRKGQTIVVVDEEETSAIAKPEHVDKRMKEAKIYYPSRDDPEAVEICYEDINCLDPEGYLTSTIMNFYIRYLQQRAFSTNRVKCNYHFFNTYFYEKLKEAVSNKGKDKDNYFAKFRRWWKGVNIFQKAYVLIPIHEALHWSLVIICFPRKEDDAGPIILHLDSLGLHSSRSIFDNIRSYIKEEWYYLDREVADLDLPMSDRTWKNLSRRIEEKVIEVPQQKNDYDCGLFVLYFMERFIEEAPDRLKRKDLDMFGKQWFKPEEASNLRVKIKNLLREEFHSTNVKRPRFRFSLDSSSSD